MPQSEQQFEMPGYVARGVLACPPQPFPEIGADRSDPILPNAIDCRSKVIPVTGSYLGHHCVELLPRPLETARPHWEQVFLLKMGEKFELDVVDQRSALQGIELVNRLWYLAR